MAQRKEALQQRCMHLNSMQACAALQRQTGAFVQAARCSQHICRTGHCSHCCLPRWELLTMMRDTDVCAEKAQAARHSRSMGHCPQACAGRVQLLGSHHQQEGRGNGQACCWQGSYQDDEVGHGKACLLGKVHPGLGRHIDQAAVEPCSTVGTASSLWGALIFLTVFHRAMHCLWD